MSTFVMGVEYVQISCGGGDNGRCDISFGMTRTFYDHTKRTGETWYCPKGHPRAWGGKTTETQLKEATGRELALKDQLSAAIREAEGNRAALMRDRSRFAAGVCPCCTRSFDNVRRHMTSEHPDYDVTRIKHKVAKVYGCSCGSEFESFRGLRTHQGHARSTSGRWQWDLPDQDRWYAHLTVVKA
jgi:hypothetical protein